MRTLDMRITILQEQHWIWELPLYNKNGCNENCHLKTATHDMRITIKNVRYEDYQHRIRTVGLRIATHNDNTRYEKYHQQRSIWELLSYNKNSRFEISHLNTRYEKYHQQRPICELLSYNKNSRHENHHQQHSIWELPSTALDMRICNRQ